MVRMAAALMSAQATSWVVTILGLVVVPRYLGTSAFGHLALAGTVASFALAISSLGTATYVIKEISRRPQDAAHIAGGTLAVRIAVWAVLALIVVPVTVLLVGNPALQAAILILFLATCFDLVKTGGYSMLQAGYSLGRAAVFQAFIGLGAQVAIVGLLLSGRGLTSVTVALAMGSVLSAGVTLVLVWRRYGLALPGRAALRALVTGSLVYFAWDVALMIFGSVDIFMLSLLAGSTATGAYAFALRLTAVPSFAHAILAGTIFPSLSAAGRAHPDVFRDLLRRTLRILVVATIPMGVGIALLAPGLTRLVGGDGYEAAVPSVVVMALVVPLIGVDTVLGTALFAADKQRAWITIAWGAAVLNPALNLVSIPLAGSLWDNPALGAALSTATTEVLMGACAWRLLGPFADFRAVASMTLRVLAACALMAPPVLLASQAWGTVPAVAVGAAVYGTAAIAMGLVRRDDLSDLRATWRSRKAPEAQPVSA